MFVKLTTLACALGVAASGAWNGLLAGGLPAASVPAGISPQACPNYPHCSNPAVAVERNAPASHADPNNLNPYYNQRSNHYNRAQYVPAHQYNAAVENNNALLTGEYTGDGDYRGEGLAESGAFGPIDDAATYDATPAPQAYHNQIYQAPRFNHAAYHSQKGAYNQPRNLPAGVDPSFCPNYPFCS